MNANDTIHLTFILFTCNDKSIPHLIEEWEHRAEIRLSNPILFILVIFYRPSFIISLIESYILRKACEWTVLQCHLRSVQIKQNSQQHFITKIEEMGCGTSEESVANVVLPDATSTTVIPTSDHYDRKDLIGVGSHGRVYRALHDSSGRQYAVKVIDQLGGTGAQIGVRERKGLVERLKRLRHVGIEGYVQVEVREGEVAIVMGLAAEGTLKKFLQKNGKMTEAAASKITGQMLEALAYLHANGVMHKDLKPSNILVRGATIQLSDFALAEIYDSRLSQKGDKQVADFSRGNSIPYMAPELIKHEGISEKADVWSLGCVLLEAITGKTPWIEINSKFQKAFKQITARAIPPLPKDISSGCKDFLERCLLVSPIKRYSVSELQKHPFIVGSTFKPEGEDIDSVKMSLERTDTVNRINSRNSNKKQQKEENPKTPLSIEKSLKLKDSGKVKQIETEVVQISKSSDQLKKLKEAVHNFGKVKKSRDGCTINDDDILPEITEEEEGVMLNNRRVKLNPALKIKTEQTDHSQQREYRNSIQLQDNSSSLSLYPDQRHRVSSKPNYSRLDSDADSRIKLETEPILMGDGERDPEYFKKPLKLLKRKLKQRQKNSRARYIDQSEYLLPERGRKQQEAQGEAGQQQSKIRTLSQQRQEAAINTQLAKAERDRYINQQLAMRQQKQREKAKWQQQLKQQSQIIKKEFSHRYAYQRYHPVLNMI